MNETNDASAIFAPIWKRKWLILLAGVLVAAAAYAYFKHKPPVYGATTQVYLGNGAEERGLVGGAKAAQPNGTNAAALINSPLVHEALVRRLRAQRTQVALFAARGRLSAKGSEKSQFIAITAEARSKRAAALLANTAAQTYIARQNENHVREIEREISLTHRQLLRVEAALAASSVGKKAGAGATNTSETLQATNLTAKINQLESDLSISGVKQVGTVKPANATLLAPKPRQNAIFGFVIGIFLTSVAAYALSRFDRRVRSLAAMEEIFQTHILTALPTVRRPIVRREGRLAPSRHLTESLLRLHTTLRLGEAVNGHPTTRPRSILLLSADPGDGKSTLAAALALVAGDAGEQVLLIEANFRRPIQTTLLDVAAPQALTQVLSGAVALDEVAPTVGATGARQDMSEAQEYASVATTVAASSAGTISLLSGQAGVANPPALLAGPAMTNLLRAAAEDFDQTLVDAPAPLQVSDAMPLLGTVDGIVLVARVGHTREVSARRLVELLRRTPSAPVLGVVANSVAPREIERYGFSPAQNHRGWRGNLNR